MVMLKEKDTSLYLKLEQQEIRPQFYAFRWLTLLLSQEFPLPGKNLIIRSSTGGMPKRVACAMLTKLNNRWHLCAECFQLTLEVALYRGQLNDF